MKRRMMLFVFSAAVTLLVGCGSSDSSTNAPQAADPNNTGTTPIATPTLSPNGVPDLSRSVPIQIPTTGDYSKFAELLEVQIYPPVVGNPEIQMTGTISHATGLANSDVSMLIGIEDNYGWAGAIWNAFTYASTYSNSKLNLYFSDADASLWVAGTVDSSGTWNGTVMYRMRAPGEIQCEPVTVNCNGAPAAQCNYYTQQAQQNARDNCISYMNPNTSTKVKVLGYFSKPSAISTSGWLNVQ